MTGRHAIPATRHAAETLVEGIRQQLACQPTTRHPRPATSATRRKRLPGRLAYALCGFAAGLLVAVGRFVASRGWREPDCGRPRGRNCALVPLGDQAERRVVPPDGGNLSRRSALDRRDQRRGPLGRAGLGAPFPGPRRWWSARSCSSGSGGNLRGTESSRPMSSAAAKSWSRSRRVRSRRAACRSGPIGCRTGTWPWMRASA